MNPRPVCGFLPFTVGWLFSVTLLQEIYVTTRHFKANKSPLGRLPRRARDALSTGGVCHFMCVYRSEVGRCRLTVSKPVLNAAYSNGFST